MRKALAALVIVGLALIPGGAGARQQAEYAHRFEQVWSAAIRLIRVDYGCTIGDRDEEIGFFTFEWRDGNRTHPGSMEVVRFRGANGAEQVRAVVQIPAMPSYVELMILDRLGRKLLEDYGEPPRPPRERRDPPRDGPDAGAPDAGTRR